MIFWLGTQVTKVKGPVPTGWRTMSLPHLRMAAGLTMPIEKSARFDKKVASTCLSVTTTVWASGAATLATTGSKKLSQYS
ncbi:hypothetical protein D3C72_584400 [compost metagenome]